RSVECTVRKCCRAATRAPPTAPASRDRCPSPSRRRRPSLPTQPVLPCVARAAATSRAGVPRTSLLSGPQCPRTLPTADAFERYHGTRRTQTKVPRVAVRPALRVPSGGTPARSVRGRRGCGVLVVVTVDLGDETIGHDVDLRDADPVGPGTVR